MGVPTFYRWLHERFSKCISDYPEPSSSSADDWSDEPNPSGVEFDHFYLDFNGIVHNVTHPSDRAAPPTQEAMMLEVFRAVDRLVLAARPRRLLYLALDGVAPRAKMDQQRARRFMAAREREAEVRAQARAEATAGGRAEAERDGFFDHNAITPGTEFMLRLGDCLRYYCAHRAARSRAWRRLAVVLSDASEAGEGEHKIMQFVRQQRLQPGYDPNTSHLVYGLDADLVMLGLATHEPHFYILRDFVPIGRLRFLQVCPVCGGSHAAAACDVLVAARAHQDGGQRDAEMASRVPYKSLQLLDVSLVREYLLNLLRREAFMPPRPQPPIAAGVVGSNRNDGGKGSGSGSSGGGGSGGGGGAAGAPPSQWWDSERVIDDFVLLTFLVGNDFLPPLPGLAIAKGGLDRVLDTYRHARASLPGYLLREGELQLPALKGFLRALASAEAEVSALKEARKGTSAKPRGRATQSQLRREQAGEPAAATLGLSAVAATAEDDGSDDDDEEVEAAVPQAGEAPSSRREDPSVARPKSLAESSCVRTPEQRRQAEYALCFGSAFDAQALAALCSSQLRGLAWCAHYYFHGCADWRWHFGFHYAAFAADLADACDNADAALQPWGDEGPLQPVQALASVLPPMSAALLPASYQPLLASTSPLADMFPESVQLDMRGKKHEWQAVVLLPFVQLPRLLSHLDDCSLTDEEAERNRCCLSLLFVSSAHFIVADPADSSDGTLTASPASRPGHSRPRARRTLSHQAGVLAGSITAVAAPPDGQLPPPPGLDHLDSVSAGDFRCYELRPPTLGRHKCELLAGATPPPPRLSLEDVAAASHAKDFVPLAAVSAGEARAPGQRVEERQSNKKKKRKAGREPGVTEPRVALPREQLGTEGGTSPGDDFMRGGLFGFSM